MFQEESQDFIVFFFQAEDGIRAYKVTGVQTCALPIYEFRQPDRRRVQYVTLSRKDFETAATDAEVEKFYHEHIKEFESPRQVRAAHVLVRVPETGGSEAEDRARAKVADVIRRTK